MTVAQWIVVALAALPAIESYLNLRDRRRRNRALRRRLDIDVRIRLKRR
jgi:hypothetical protein